MRRRLAHQASSHYLQASAQRTRSMFSKQSHFHTSNTLFNMNPYEILGVSRNASQDEIKRKYRQLSKQYHPDLNKEPNAQDKFSEITNAYEVLSDPQKRQMYDQTGSTDGNAGFDFSDIFGGGFGRPSRRSVEDIQLQLTVTLREVFMGATKSVSYARNVLCNTCDGTGSKTKRSKTCPTCNGTGVVVQVRQVGPGMVQQFSTICGTCKGSGIKVDKGDECSSCKGKATVKETKTVDIPLNGAFDGCTMVLPGEGNQEPNLAPGSVQLTIHVAGDKVFKVKDDHDLLIHRKISLYQAITGTTELVLVHLDGRKLLLKVEDKVIKPGALFAISGEGLPKQTGERGDLIVQFDVEFPKEPVDLEVHRELMNILPTRPANEQNVFEKPDITGATIVHLKPYLQKKQRESNSGDGQKVSCAQQ